MPIKNRENVESIAAFPVEDLPPNEELSVAEPTHSFILSILQVGAIESLVLRKYRNQIFVEAGNRRIKALRYAKQMLEEDPNLKIEYGIKNTKHLETVSVIIYKGVNATDGAMMSILSNEQRNLNDLNSYQNIKKLQELGQWERLNGMIKMNPGRVKKLMTLDNIENKDLFFQAFADGKIAIGTLFKIAKLSTPRQKFAEDLFKQNGKLVGKDIKAARTADAQAVLTTFKMDDLKPPEIKHARLYVYRCPDGSFEEPTEEFSGVHEKALKNGGTAFELVRIG